MKFLSSLFLQTTIGKKGTITEDDGELTVPSLIQPVIRLGFPFARNLVISGSTKEGSFLESNSISRTGASGVTSVDFQSLSAGFWIIEGSISFSFTGTSSSAQSAGIQLIDPQSGAENLSAMPIFTGVSVVTPFSTQFSLPTDGWFVRLRMGGTVALDVGFIFACLNFTRIL